MQLTGKVKPIWILLKQETVSGSGISWATIQIFTGQMPNQQHQRTEGIPYIQIYIPYIPNIHVTIHSKVQLFTTACLC